MKTFLEKVSQNREFSFQFSAFIDVVYEIKNQSVFKNKNFHYYQK